MIDDWFANHNLILDAAWVGRIILVGRFNTREVGLYLYRHNPQDISPAYRKQFQDVASLSFPAFMNQHRPGPVERITLLAHGNLPARWAKLYTPAAAAAKAAEEGERLDGEVYHAVHLAQESVWFERAASSSQQPEYLEEAGSEESVFGTAGGGAWLPHSAERSTEVLARGRSVLLSLRRHLVEYTAFGGRAHHLLICFQRALTECLLPEMAPVATGGALPGGLWPAVFALLFSTRTDAQVDLAAVDWNVPGSDWNKVPARPEWMTHLEAVIHTFRDVLVQGRSGQPGSVRPYGEQAIGELIERVVDRHPGGPAVLRDDFRRARQARLTLCDVLDNKLMLNCIFEYVLHSYKALPQVSALFTRDPPDLTAAYEFLQTMISTADGSVLAKPVRRPSLQEGERLVDEIVHTLEQWIEVFAAEPEHAEVLVAAMDEVTRKIHAELCAGGHADELQQLRAHDKQRAGLIDFLRHTVHDVLGPTLFRTPVVSYGQLAEALTKRLGDLYNEAVLVTPGTFTEIREVGAAWSAAVEERVPEDGTDAVDWGDLPGLIGRTFLERVVLGRNLLDRLRSGDDKVKIATLVAQIRATADAARPDGADVPRLPLYAEATDPLGAMVNRTLSRSPVTPAQVHTYAAALTTRAEDQPSGLRPLAAPALPDDGPTEEEEGPPQAAPGLGRPGPEEAALVTTDPGGVLTALAQVAARPPGEPDAVLAELAADPLFVASVRAAELIHDEVWSAVRSKYNSPVANTGFRRSVEVHTLAELILARQASLGLGKEGSFLFRLLLDVLELAGDDGDLRTFMRAHSLTEYVVPERLGDAWFQKLENLVMAGVAQMNTMSGFVSDLRGMEHLFRHVAHNQNAEILFLNATADEYMEWIAGSNGDREGWVSPFEVGALASAEPGQRDAFLAPMVVVMTDAAFRDEHQKRAWLEQLSPGHLVQRSKAPLLIPPVVVSAADQRSATDLRAAASGAAVAVHVLAPSPRLNQAGDSFATRLPAGYLLAARLLGGTGQRLLNPGLREQPTGRLQVLGAGTASMDESLRRIVDGYFVDDELRNVPLSADIYLYVVLTLVAHAQVHGTLAGRSGPDALVNGLYRYLFRPATGFNDQTFRHADLLSRFLPRRGTSFAFAEDLTLANAAQATPGALLYTRSGGSVAESDASDLFTVTDIEWWRRLRAAYRLP